MLSSDADLRISNGPGVSGGVGIIVEVKTRKKRVANLWTKLQAHRGAALATNGKELQNP
jgi:hypothetical protein